MAVSPKPKENITIETSKCLIIHHELHYNDDKRFLRVGILFSVCFVKDSMLISIYLYLLCTISVSRCVVHDEFRKLSK